MKNNRILFLASLVFLMFSCSGTSENSSEVSTQNYITVIKDSLVIDRLSTLKMLDYHDESGKLLMLDEQLGEIFILDENGEKISSFEPYVEGPNYVESQNFGWVFLNANELMAYGRVYFHRLSVEGERLERIEYPIEVRGWALLDYDPLMIEAFEVSEGQTQVLTMIPGALGMSMRDSDVQDTASVMYKMDLASGQVQVVLNKPEKSIYKEAGQYYGAGRPLITKLNDNHLAFTHLADTSVFIYDLKGEQLLSTIGIPKEFQPDVKPVSFNSKDQPKESFVNALIYSTGNQILIERIGQIPDEVYAEIRAMGGMWWQSPEMEAAVKKYMTRKRSLYSENQFLGEVEWNVGGGFQNIISTNSDFLWVQRDYSDERDYRTFLKVKIVPVEE